MIKYALGSFFLSLLLTIILVMIFKQMEVYIAMGVGAFTGWLLCVWFIRSQKRVPSEKERKIILAIYGVCIALLFLLIAIAAPKVTGAGIIIMILNTICYPAFLSLIFNQKTLELELEKFNSKNSGIES